MWKKNKRGQAIFAGIMIFVMAFIFLVTLITPIKSVVTDARSADKLDCTNASISTGDKMTCIIADLYLPYFFGIGIAAAGGYLILKKTQFVQE